MTKARSVLTIFALSKTRLYKVPSGCRLLDIGIEGYLAAGGRAVFVVQYWREAKFGERPLWHVVALWDGGLLEVPGDVLALLVLGGGPTGCEMAQVYARFGVPTTIVQSGDRLMPTDHPRNAAAVTEGLKASGVDVRLGVRATAARAKAGRDGAHVIELDDGTTAEGHAGAHGLHRFEPTGSLARILAGIHEGHRRLYQLENRHIRRCAYLQCAELLCSAYNARRIDGGVVFLRREWTLSYFSHLRRSRWFAPST
jgi:hypothetical protein